MIVLHTDTVALRKRQRRKKKLSLKSKVAHLGPPVVVPADAERPRWTSSAPALPAVSRMLSPATPGALSLRSASTSVSHTFLTRASSADETRGRLPSPIVVTAARTLGAARCQSAVANWSPSATARWCVCAKHVSRPCCDESARSVCRRVLRACTALTPAAATESAASAAIELKPSPCSAPASAPACPPASSPTHRLHCAMRSRAKRLRASSVTVLCMCNRRADS
mmetsp:Transcript_20739/g.64458  ORF Transcript_20739/g.64458 Transcript_20739/m.64458 type:complete len:225 (-) Transcript_20739:149-823(-)